MKDLKTLLELAESAARAASEHLLAEVKGYRTVKVEERRDVKLQADIESEKLIRKLLWAETDYPIIGEEQGGDPSLTEGSEPYWIVDPLDGTYNYFRDLPMACVSIGLFRGETPLLGVIYDFYRDELFAGIDAQGFFMNGQAHLPQWAEAIAKASLATGFPAECDLSSPALERFNSQIRRFKKIRLFGSAALSLAYVAAGRLDAYHEESIKLWDVAAGLALVQAVGGTVHMLPMADQPLSYDVWAAGRPEFIL